MSQKDIQFCKAAYENFSLLGYWWWITKKFFQLARSPGTKVLLKQKWYFVCSPKGDVLVMFGAGEDKKDAAVLLASHMQYLEESPSLTRLKLAVDNTKVK